jgi:hypothetical protein
MAVAGVILFVLASIIFAVVNFAKGKVGWGIFALFGSVLAIPPAIRLARPDSWWARNAYDEEKRARAEERFSVEERLGSFETPLEDPRRRHPVGEALLRFECRICGEEFERREDAEHHVERLHQDATVSPSAAVSELPASG